MSNPEAPRSGGRRVRPAFLLPLLIFAVLAAVFLLKLESGGDPSAIPSALIGKPAPEFDLPALDGSDRPGFKRGDLIGPVTVVNVFASWCGPCREEHPQLTELAKDGRIRLVGINYKDQAENARRFLGQFGNPYAAIGVDTKGRAAIDWGVYGVPETFIVGRDGTIIRKFVGPISAEALESAVKPAIDSAIAGQAPAG
jgi:cytochrome c biogenesis protein CcmG/thiol:disulfide interchange protein DsbE